MGAPPHLDGLVARAADPGRAARVVDRLLERPDRRGLLADDPVLAERVVAVAAGSGWLGRLLVSDPEALTVLGDLEQPPALVPERAEDLRRWRKLEHLRIAGRDLTGIDSVTTTMVGLSAAAATLVEAGLALADAGHLAVIAMGKAGAHELNYSSDLDLLLVGPTGDADDQGAARRLMRFVEPALRLDLALRPEGRDGALVRTVESYRTHWERRAEPWERQALLKARPIAGDTALGQGFAAASADALWERGFDAEAIRAVRAMKARTEAAALAAGGGRDVKRAPGGIRDVEFAVQLLQLVHGPLDPTLRVRATLAALTSLRGGGYVGDDDARWLAAAYLLLRRVEHALQLDEDRQTHRVPTDEATRDRLARILGISARPRASAADDLEVELRACQATVRAIHERVYFRPLLDAFIGVASPLTPDAAAARLVAFGFSGGPRTHQAVVELTRGLTRSSRLMGRMLPLVLDWLSAAPDPDRGLLGLRQLVAAEPRQVTASFRESPETARRTCILAGTSESVLRRLLHEPDVLPTIGRPDALGQAVEALGADGESPWGSPADPSLLRRRVNEATLLIAAHDVLDGAPPELVGGALARVAHRSVEAALAHADPQVPLVVMAAGRLAGGSLGYASDLDLVIVHDAEDDEGRIEAERAVEEVRGTLAGRGPAERTYDVDLDLRPGGRSAPMVRSVEGLETHLLRWAEPWERLALSRMRPLCGDPGLGARVDAAVDPARGAPLTDADRRSIRRVKARSEAERIPAGEDPAFHLKLGPGALADVELTVALLLFEHGIREPGTLTGLRRLGEGGHLTDDEVAALTAAHSFCERTRNRWTLIAGRARESLPTGAELTVLARSLETTSPELRDSYQRLTRRARRIVEHRFYGQST